MKGLLVLAALGSIPGVLAEDPRVGLLAPSSGFGWDGRHLLVADLDRDGDSDLVHLPNGAGSWGDPHAYWIENLGNRRFAVLRMLHVAPLGSEETLVFPALRNLTGDANPEFFVNRQSTDRFEPLALVPAFSPPIPAHGVALAGSNPEPWHGHRPWTNASELLGFGHFLPIDWTPPPRFQFWNLVLPKHGVPIEHCSNGSRARYNRAE